MADATHEGKTIQDRYELGKKLGEGGVGAVYEATQLAIGRTVAIKVLRSDFEASDDHRKRFEIEAKAVGRLNHAHVLTLHDFGYSEELRAFFMVTEFVDGESLGEWLDRDEWPEPDVILSIVRQVAKALNHAHSHGIVHRDLKPENVMLSRDSEGAIVAKVLDFGLARLFEPDPEDADAAAKKLSRLTQEGFIFGTPSYMAPEQCMGKLDIGPAADLYALGVMLFELFERELPYEAPTFNRLIFMTVQDPIPEQTSADTPPEIRDLIISLMQKEPESRPGSALEVVKAINAVLDDASLSREVAALAVEDESGDDVEALTPREAEPMASSPPVTPLVVLGVAACVLVAVAVFLVAGEAAEPVEATPGIESAVSTTTPATPTVEGTALARPDEGGPSRDETPDPTAVERAETSGRDAGKVVAGSTTETAEGAASQRRPPKKAGSPSKPAKPPSSGQETTTKTKTETKTKTKTESRGLVPLN